MYAWFSVTNQLYLETIQYVYLFCLQEVAVISISKSGHAKNVKIPVS